MGDEISPVPKREFTAARLIIRGSIAKDACIIASAGSETQQRNRECC